jgi:formate dehydrogenase major subunit
MVTGRIKPLHMNGRVVHQVGLPFHWGYAGESTGAIANDLTSLVADPNVSIHESKAFVCQVERAREPVDERATKSFAPRPMRQRTPQTPRSAQPEGR